jgi:hypothetical protein
MSVNFKAYSTARFVSVHAEKLTPFYNCTDDIKELKFLQLFKNLLQF